MLKTEPDSDRLREALTRELRGDRGRIRSVQGRDIMTGWSIMFRSVCLRRYMRSL